MNKIIFIVALMVSTLAVGCASGQLHSESPMGRQDEALARMPEACSGATVRQRLGNHGVELGGVTYFCGAY